MNFIQRMMQGRYGSDQLSFFLLGFYVLLYLLSLVLNNSLLSFLSLVLAAYGLWRMLSRNVTRRRAENAKFLTMAGPTIAWFKLRRAKLRDKDHRYFKCPNCGQHLRVPRGKGKMTISCRNCGVSFDEKT